MPIPLRQAQDRPAQDLVGLTQFADLVLQRLHLVGHLSRDTAALAAVDLGLLHPLMQRLRNAADLLGNRYHGRPPGRVIPLVIKNHPHQSLADFECKRVGRLASYGSTFLGVGASDKLGAVHLGLPIRTATKRPGLNVLGPSISAPIPRLHKQKCSL